jgi:hypothetical protein
MKLFRVKMLHSFDQLFAGESYNLTRDRADILIEQGAAEREGPQWDGVLSVAPKAVADSQINLTLSEPAKIEPVKIEPVKVESVKPKAPKQVLHMPKRPAVKHSAKPMPKAKAK